LHFNQIVELDSNHMPLHCSVEKITGNEELFTHWVGMVQVVAMVEQNRTNLLFIL
jgi:hypothetical protein